MADDTLPVAGSPDAIWLCYGDLTDWHHERHHHEIVREAQVGWCDEPIDPTDMRYVRADIADALTAEVERLRAEAEDDTRVRDTMRDILNRVAIALRGDPPPLTSWGWHDLPDRVAAVVKLAAALTTAAAQAKGGSDA